MTIDLEQFAQLLTKYCVKSQSIKNEIEILCEIIVSEKDDSIKQIALSTLRELL